MPDPEFYESFPALLRSHWERNDRPEDFDRDLRFMVFTALEIYMSGRKPPPPRPLQQVTREMRSGGPRVEHPPELLSVYGWLAMQRREGRETRRRTRR